MRSGVGPPLSHPAGFATEVVNSKRSTHRRETRWVEKEDGASRGRENMKCVSTRSAVTSTCSSHTWAASQELFMHPMGFYTSLYYQDCIHDEPVMVENSRVKNATPAIPD